MYNDDIDERQWIIQYQGIKNNISSIRQKCIQIKESELNEIKSCINNLDNDLKSMAASPMQYELAKSEISRRQLITDNLRKGLANISIAGSSNSSSASSSSNPMHNGSGSNINNGRGSFISMSDLSAGRNSITSQSEKSLIQRQNEVIKQQDMMLGDISLGVDRLHHSALIIGDEAKQHTKILEKLDVQVDAAAQGLRDEAQHAEKVRQKSKTCALYICIAVEILIILLMGGLYYIDGKKA
jgi:hypothetical protein